MSARFVVEDVFSRYRFEGTGTQVIRYVSRLIAAEPRTKYRARRALNALAAGNYEQANEELAKLGIIFYRRGGKLETRRQNRDPRRWGPQTSEAIQSLRNLPAGQANPRFVRTPQGVYPLNEAAREMRNPEPPAKKEPAPAARKPWWRIW